MCPARDIEALAERLSQPEAGASVLRFDSEHAQGLVSQYSILLRKNVIAYWRYPSYNAVRFTFTAIFGLLMGAVFWRAGANRCAYVPLLVPNQAVPLHAHVTSTLSLADSSLHAGNQLPWAAHSLCAARAQSDLSLLCGAGPPRLGCCKWWPRSTCQRSS